MENQINALRTTMETLEIEIMELDSNIKHYKALRQKIQKAYSALEEHSCFANITEQLTAENENLNSAIELSLNDIKEKKAVIKKYEKAIATLNGLLDANGTTS
jgi:chromosome segregation ATPase